MGPTNTIEKSDEGICIQDEDSMPLLVEAHER